MINLDRDDATKRVLRLVITGPVGAGKSTFVRNINSAKILSTERLATDSTARLKRNTTVAFDFGQLKINSQTTIQLYGTPGQSRFDFMWDILIKYAHGYILLVPAHRPSEFGNAKAILDFMQQRTCVPMAIGITHQDHKDAKSTISIAIALGLISRPEVPPIIGINATDKVSVGQAISSVLSRSKMHCWV